ncbi:MAG: type II toxin-antitoxin system RelE/ParE family toxin [Bacteroidetes bacterium]|nr:type II toxin-antitoxin system RelE/ParE family toxin [Bacteroidota bacterium]
MKYILLISKSVTKFILSRNQKEQAIFKIKLNLLIENPFSHPQLDIKSMKGQQNIYRLRIGKYKLIYQVDGDKLIVFMMTAGMRGDVYKSHY